MQQLQYIGMSRQVAASVAAHLTDLPERCSYVRVRAVPGGAKAELQAAWKEWVVEHGAVPPGNAKGNTDWTARKAPVSAGSSAASVAARAAPAAPPRPSAEQLRAKVTRCANDTAMAAVTAQAYEQLVTRGYVVLEGVLSAQQVAAARAGAEALQGAGCMAPVMQQRGQGREDDIVVLDEEGAGARVVLRSGPRARAASSDAGLQAVLAGPDCGGLGAVASILKGVPHALMARQAQRAASGAAEGGDSGAWAMPELAVSESLMLACYPGGGAYYAVHKDNDTPADEVAPPEGGGGGAWSGPPGQRVRDRAVTALLYLNDAWQPEENGGCLRIHEPDESGRTIDVAPEGGRLVLFQSRLVDHEVMPAFRPRWALSAWIPALEAFAQ